MAKATMGDDERVERATEVQPGLMASPWEPDRCPHGKLRYCRWLWRPARGETIQDADAELGPCRCAKCAADDS